jgi:magnesium-transporting ATPase (P-type)
MMMQSARLSAVIIFLLFGRFLLSPMSILVLGLVFDFAAALIMAFRRPSTRIHIEKQKDVTDAGIMKSSVKCIEKGAFCGLLIIVFCIVFAMLGITGRTSVSSCVFLSFVVLSAAVLLHSIFNGKPAGSELKVNRIQLFYFIGVALIVVLSCLIGKFTSVLTGDPPSAMSFKMLVSVIFSPILSLVLSSLLVKATGLLKGKGKRKKDKDTVI